MSHVRLGVIALLVVAACQAERRALPQNYDSLAQSAPRRSVADNPIKEALTPGRRVSMDDRLGVPSFLWTDKQADTRGLDAGSAARAHIDLYATAYRMSNADVADLKLASVHDIGTGPVIARFRQEVKGVPVFRDELRALLDRNHQLIALSGTAVGDTRKWEEKEDAFVTDPRDAIAFAFADLTGQQLDATSLEFAGESAAGYAKFLTNRADLAPVRYRKTFFRSSKGLVPAYYMELHASNPAAKESTVYSYVVAADAPAVLFRKNMVSDATFTYRVYADSTEPYTPFDSPQGTYPTPNPNPPENADPETFATQSSVSLSNVPFSRNDPWLAAGATETRGNNVDAYADITSPDGYSDGDLRAATTAAGVFDYAYDPTLEAQANELQVKAAIVNLFYVNNWLHDWYYDAGFDELSGNAQRSNYGRGGQENDPLLAEAQDNSGLSNANMYTPADGESPVMQMYLFPTYDSLLTVTSTNSFTTTVVGGAEWNTENFPVAGIEGELVKADPYTACTPLMNDVTGKIVLIQRGDCAFSAKAAQAATAGAIGVLIGNALTSANADEPITMAGGGTEIPAFHLRVSMAQTLEAELMLGAVTINMKQTISFRDGTMDNSIIAHEWGHYISNRLVGDGNGLNSNFSRGLGEGWSDFHSLLMQVRDGDDFASAFPMGPFVTSELSVDNFYFGIRRYPYSSEETINPLLYSHINRYSDLPDGPPVAGAAGDNAEVHNVGEVWASMLWEGFSKMLSDALPGDFEATRTRMRNYLVAAYKMTPPRDPTLLEARDALLAVIRASGNMADYDAFAEGFAQRGAGVGAHEVNQRYTATNEGATNNFSTHVAITKVELIDDTGCEDGVLAAGESGAVRVWVKNFGANPVLGLQATVQSEQAGVTLAGASTFPDIAPGQQQSADVVISLDVSATFDVLSLGVTLTDEQPELVDLRVNYRDRPASGRSDDVEPKATAWQTVQHPSFETRYPWVRIEWSQVDHAWHGIDLPTVSDISLVSPLLWVRPAGDFVISFDAAHSFETDGGTNYDGGVIELSVNGGEWEDIGTELYTGALVNGGTTLGGRDAFTGANESYPFYDHYELNLGEGYAGQPVRVRFRIATDGGVGEDGWYLDNIDFANVENKPFPTREQGPFAACVTTMPAVALPSPQDVLPGATVTATPEVISGPLETPVYTWVQVSGPPVSFTPNDATLSFEAPAVAASTSIVFVLHTDFADVSAPDAVLVVNVIRLNPNDAVADAGPDQTVTEGDVVTLDATASSDADGDPLQYEWIQVDGPDVVLSDVSVAQPTFTAPGAPAELVFAVVVDDQGINDGSDYDFVTITVEAAVPVNTAPVISLDSAQTVAAGAEVTLDASGSTDDEPLSFVWAQISGDAVTLPATDAATVTFTAPAVDATLVFEVSVSDGTNIAKKQTTITVHRENTKPECLVSASVANGRVTLDATTTDGEDDTLTLFWTQTAGDPVGLKDPKTKSPSFQIPPITAATTFSFELVAYDGALFSDAATVSVTVDPTQVVATPTTEEEHDHDTDADPTDEPKQGCACSSGSSADQAGTLLLGALVVLALRRRRR